MIEIEGERQRKKARYENIYNKQKKLLKKENLPDNIDDIKLNNEEEEEENSSEQSNLNQNKILNEETTKYVRTNKSPIDSIHTFDEFNVKFINPSTLNNVSIPNDKYINFVHKMQHEVDNMYERESKWERMSGIKNVDNLELPKLCLIKAKHVAKYLLPCNTENGERACIRGDDCFSNVIPHSKGTVILREFLNVDEDKEFDENHMVPTEQGICIICLHAFVFYLWLKKKLMRKSLKDKNDKEDDKSCIQPHYYEVDKPGEYKSGSCIHPTPEKFEGIARPFRSFDLKDYVENIKGPGLMEDSRVFF